MGNKKTKNDDHHLSKEVTGFCKKHANAVNIISTWRKVAEQAEWKKKD